MKLTKQDIDKVRHIEGFPIADDEDIIALSNPPYYTACPNPFIEDFIKEHSKPYDEEMDDYKREPFASDIREGKNDPMYMAHGYHTKVPYKAIMRYILHYTEPGDIVFDGFCGTGMTGIAAQMCQDPDTDFKMQLEKEMKNIKWGARKAILNDLSTVATFISRNYNSPVDIMKFEKEAIRILEECKNECGWMYETNHVDEKGNELKGLDGEQLKGNINYTVWSDVFICPNCTNEESYWKTAVDKNTNREVKKPCCNHCGLELSIHTITRSKEMFFDKKLNTATEQVKQLPVIIKYTYGKKQYKKEVDKFDIEIINRINNIDIPYNYPTDEIPDGFNTEQPKKSHNVSRVHQFYTRRNLYVLSLVFDKINKISEKRIKDHLIFWFSSIYTRSHKLNRYMPNHNRHVGPLSGTLYIPYFQAEINILNLLDDKLKSIKKVHAICDGICLTTQSMTQIENIKSNSIDYIFTDPPFGDNLNYSELNFIWESWLKVKTNNKQEAIMNKVQEKGLLEYQELMTKCFEEYYRVLKPNRWMTVEFSNSKNAVWIAIQEALSRAGFIVADIRVLDKVKGTTKQLSYASSVKQDLIISSYKPRDSFNKKMLEHAGTEETVWDFVREHLIKLPVIVQNGEKIEPVREREAFLLYDRMLAYHIVTGIAVPIDAGDFYKGLDERFLKRDNMYFLHDQINKYDDARIVSELEPIQFTLYVCDEKSAIAWLYKQLENPHTYGEIQPKFVQELRQEKHEKMPELMELLEENFLQDEKGKWYIPDVTKEGDLVKLREKRLLKEFEEYLTGKGKLKLFRTEAVRAGFAKLWKNKDYQNIVKVANRLPDKVIQEDPKLLMYYDISLGRVE